MEQTLTLREAGTRLGVTGKALKRLIRSGVLPEARKISSSSGRAWVIPVDALPRIAERQGWVIDLTGDEPLLAVAADYTETSNSEPKTPDGPIDNTPNQDLPTMIDPFNGSSVDQPKQMPASTPTVPQADTPTVEAKSGDSLPDNVEAQSAELAPEYETIRLERLSPFKPFTTNQDLTPHSHEMAEVYNLNANQTHSSQSTTKSSTESSTESTPHSSNGDGTGSEFERDRTGTEDPSPNQTQFPGVTNAMKPTPISQDVPNADGSPNEPRAGHPPLPNQPPLADIDLSTSTDLTASSNHSVAADLPTGTERSTGTGLAAVEMGALIPHRANQDSPSEAESSSSPSLADVLDVALLDRLLGAQEEKANAVAKARQTEESLTALNERNEQALSEIEVVRREADLTADRLSEERMARIVADAKVAELRDRVIREMTLADSEKNARVEATMRNIQAERENANAYASMGWMARRRYRRLNRGENTNG